MVCDQMLNIQKAILFSSNTYIEERTMFLKYGFLNSPIQCSILIYMERTIWENYKNIGEGSYRNVSNSLNTFPHIINFLHPLLQSHLSLSLLTSNKDLGIKKAFIYSKKNNNWYRNNKVEMKSKVKYKLTKKWSK